MEQKSIAELISCANNSKEFIELKEYYKQLSFMQVVGCSRLELQHSNFIAWLLNSKSDHNLGTAPIVKFLSMIALCKEKDINNSIDYDDDFLNSFINENFNVMDVEINTERAVVKDNSKNDNKTRIDIEILVSSMINNQKKILPIIIENKVKSKEHDKQTQYYCDWAKVQYSNERYLKPIFIYLTPDLNDKPECDEYIRICYQDLVTKLIEPMLLICKNNHSKVLIEDYLRCLSYTSEDMMKNGKGDLIMAYSERELKLLHEFWDKNKDLMYAVAKSLSEEESQKVEPILAGINEKDYTKYMFEGNKYNKRGIVLAAVKAYVRDNKIETFDELVKVFPADLNNNKSNGVVKKPNEPKDESRYFHGDDAIRNSKNEEIAWVCNQWGKGNVEDFLQKISGLLKSPIEKCE